MRKGFRIKAPALVAMIVLLLILNIGLVNSWLGQFTKYFLPIKIGIILVFSLLIVWQKNFVSKPFIFALLFCTYLIIRTKVCNGDCIYAINQLSSCFVLFSCLEWTRLRQEWKLCLFVWRYILGIIVLIDFFTMIIFPKGMYATGMYSENWFLGYKSLRFPYIYALLLISAFLDFSEKKKITAWTWLFSFVSCIEFLISKSSGALAGILLLIFGMFLTNQIHGKAKLNKIISVILDYRFYLPLYCAIAALVVVVQQSKFILYIVENIFHKDPTLTTRTQAWSLFIQSIKTNLWMGKGYLGKETYQLLSGNFYVTSAHNMALSLLMTGGIIGACLYLAILISSISGNVIETKAKEICVWGILSLLLVGLTSSAFVFSQFCFLPYGLLTLVSTHKEKKNERIY